MDVKGEVLAWWAAPDERSVGEARYRLRRALPGLGMVPEQVEDAALMVSELVTNAVCHGAAPVGVLVWECRAAGCVVVEVHDAGAGLAAAALAPGAGRSRLRAGERPGPAHGDGLLRWAVRCAPSGAGQVGLVRSTPHPGGRVCRTGRRPGRGPQHPARNPAPRTGQHLDAAAPHRRHRPGIGHGSRVEVRAARRRGRACRKSCRGERTVRCDAVAGTLPVVEAPDGGVQSSPTGIRP